MKNSRLTVLERSNALRRSMDFRSSKNSREASDLSLFTSNFLKSCSAQLMSGMARSSSVCRSLRTLQRSWNSRRPFLLVSCDLKISCAMRWRFGSASISRVFLRAPASAARAWPPAGALFAAGGFASARAPSWTVGLLASSVLTGGRASEASESDLLTPLREDTSRPPPPRPGLGEAAGPAARELTAALRSGPRGAPSPPPLARAKAAP
mmetsp:Transcript_29225/g.89937  ORF Transcript_29225/g.89937 Transcript_29225/m.89937 type:complete len:209 (-) Transcript_29225:208-834(-)